MAGSDEQIVRMARRAKAHGPDRISVAMCFEVLRYEVMTGRDPREIFRLDNGYRSFYARMVNAEPGLEGIFETRKGMWVE